MSFFWGDKLSEGFTRKTGRYEYEAEYVGIEIWRLYGNRKYPGGRKHNYFRQRPF